MAIVQAHQGNLKVQNELGKGSIFTVELPFNTPALKSFCSIEPFKGLYRRQGKRI
ncbi:hypothetical protein [Fischerella sp. JS2]|uniref:hypothetical protein n=1 Tax=Fischerella sp. JS2 TaxID=2597771 RepID=UPI0028E81D46|nr:hypothetical protein [Fischerella sp. JS2]